MDTTTKECARTAWQDLHRAVRSATLYSPGHNRVREDTTAHWRVLREGLRGSDRIEIDMTEEGAILAGKPIRSFTEGADELARLLHREGIRRLSWGPSYDEAGAFRLVEAIRPYFRTEHPPGQPLSDKLRWEPIEGLLIVIGDEVRRDDVSLDEMTHGEKAWRALLESTDPGEGEPLPLEALRAGWDCTGGAIPWPAPVAPEDLEALDREVDFADNLGAPMSRVGMILADIADLWQHDERLERVLTKIPDLVDGLLAAHHPGEAARLLAPLRRWGERLAQTPDNAPAIRLFSSLQVSLLEDRLLARLMDSIIARAVEPSKAASYFAGGGPAGPARVLEFAAATPSGPYREAIVRVAVNDLGGRPDRLASILAQAPAGPALVAFEVLSELGTTETGMRIGLDALDRSEPVLRQRATEYLMRYDHDEVGDRMMQLLLGPREIRSLALVYFTRNPRPGVFECLRAVATNARFEALPLDDRLLVARSIGFVDPRRGTDLATAILGPSWETGNLDRAAPWVMCLAAAGAREAYKALTTLDRRAGDELAEIVAEASRIWQRRYRSERGSDQKTEGQDLSDLPLPGGYRSSTAPDDRRPDTRTRGTDSRAESPDESLDPVVLTETLLEDSSLEFEIAEQQWDLALEKGSGRPRK